MELNNEAPFGTMSLAVKVEFHPENSAFSSASRVLVSETALPDEPPDTKDMLSFAAPPPLQPAL
jgi:hypothetical protein